MANHCIYNIGCESVTLIVDQKLLCVDSHDLDVDVALNVTYAWRDFFVC